MKKIGLLVFIIMMMAVVTTAQAGTRAGGLPELVIDKQIKDCGCPPCCSAADVKQKGVSTSHKKASIVLNVEFDTAKAVVKKKYHSEIKKVADFMKAYPETNAVIEGHTDNVGKETENVKLSQERANSIRQYLIDNFGINASRLTAAGYGPNKPIASNDTEEGRQKNRRVQAVIEKR